MYKKAKGSLSPLSLYGLLIHAMAAEIEREARKKGHGNNTVPSEQIVLWRGRLANLAYLNRREAGRLQIARYLVTR